MAPSTSSTELLESDPGFQRERSPGNRRLRGAGLALVAAGAVVAAMVVRTDHADASPPVAFVETWIGAWNARDAQAVSSMTCDYTPAFVAPGNIQSFLDDVPVGRPIVSHHTVTGTRAASAYGRPGVQVDLSYVPAVGTGVRERSVFVRVRHGGDLCIGYFANW